MATDLSQFSKGQKGRITEIRQESLRLALAGLGLLPGTEFTLSNKAPWNGPLALQVEGTQIAVRKEDALFIYADTIG